MNLGCTGSVRSKNSKLNGNWVSLPVGQAGVGDVEDQYAWVHVSAPGAAIRAGAGAVAAVADVKVVSENRWRRVHPPVVQRIAAYQLEVAGRAGDGRRGAGCGNCGRGSRDDARH